MPDPLIKERLELILEHIAIIMNRIQDVPDANWFISGEPGQTMFDLTYYQIATNWRKY